MIRPSFGDRWRALRNRWVANPRLQRWAAAFPLTRPIAKRRARALFDLCAGFVYSQTLSACVQLKVFERLAAGPRVVSSLAPELGLSLDATRRLLRAAAALKLREARPGDRFALAALGAAMLGNPSIGAFVAHHALLYEDLRDPVALLRGESQTQLSQFWPYAASRPGASAPPEPDATQREAYARYCDLMSQSQALIAEDVLDAYPPNRHRCWLDVGGGEGAFVKAAAARAPKLRFQLLDLPPVAARARAAFEARGLGARAKAYDGDVLSEPLPLGADVISLVRVLHDHDDESARAILSRVHAALPRGGAVLIAEPMADTPGAEPIGAAYFGFYLLAMGRGRARSPREIMDLLLATGFARARELKTRRPMLASAIVALKA